MPVDPKDAIEPGSHADRPRGILTSRDRLYLDGVSGIKPKSQQERNVRANIRERLKNVMLDFPIISSNLSQRDRELVFNREDADNKYESHDPNNGIIPAIQFFYRLDPEAFENRVQTAVEQGVRKNGWLSDIEVDINIDRQKSIEDVRETVLKTGEIFPDERHLLVTNGLYTVRIRKDITHRFGKRGEEIPLNADEVDMDINSLRISGSEEAKQKKRRAIRAVYDYVDSQNESIDTEDIVDHIFPIYPIDYEESDQWWNDFMHPALRQLSDLTISDDQNSPQPD